MEWAVVGTPIGPVSIGVSGGGVCAVRLPPTDAAPTDPVPADPVPAEGGSELLAAAAGQVRAYFAGERTSFDLPLSIPEDPTFEGAVWAELLRIPYGQMRTYGQVAGAVGDAGAARAVGTACHRNSIPVIVPCHRVVGAGGKLVGFGAGLARKRWLLEHEARITLERDWS